MDFELTEQHKKLQQVARDFAVNEVAPNAPEWDRNHRFPIEMFRRMAELGFMGMLVPEEYGGTNAGGLAMALAIEEIGRADQSVGVSLNAHLTIGTMPILTFGTEAQKQKWLVPLARGEKLGAFGSTEPGAGSDVAGIQTLAMRDGDEWVINGTKTFITNAGTDMSYGLVLLTTNGFNEQGKKLFTTFIVPRGIPGFTQGEKYEKLGWNGCDTREQVFSDCRVPQENLLGEEGAGIKQWFKVLDAGRIAVAALSLGLVQACLDLLLEETRKQPRLATQSVQHRIAEMATRAEMARLLTYRSGWMFDQRRPYAREAAIAKLVASNTANWAVGEAVDILGMPAMLESSNISRYWRDAKVLEIGEGTTEVLKLVLSREIGAR